MSRLPKYVYVIATLVVVSLLAVLGTQAYFLRESFAYQQDELEARTIEAMDGLHFYLVLASQRVRILDTGEVYDKNYTSDDSLFRFEGRVKVDLEMLNNKHYDSALASLRTRQLEAFYELLAETSGIAPGFAERIDITISQECPDCPTRDILNYNLDSLMQKEIAEAGIDLDFDFGIYDEARDAWEYHEADADTVALLKGYRTAYFVKSRNDQDFILVHYPDETSYLLRKMAWSLGATVVLVLLTITAFWYLIWLVLRQKKLSQMRSDFINNMTHELKTPIANLILGIDNIENERVIHNEASIRQFTGVMRKEGLRINRMVEHVLESATMERGELKLALEDVNLHELINRLVETWSLQINAQQGRMLTDLQASEATVTADVMHLTNSISNLLDNAAKYTRDRPQISLRTFNNGSHIHLQVIDNGIGMSRSTLKHVFEQFYRVPTDNVHNVKGFGLGLSYVKRIVEALRGEIRVSSKPGEGSVFELVLPLAAAT